MRKLVGLIIGGIVGTGLIVALISGLGWLVNTIISNKILIIVAIVLMLVMLFRAIND